MKRTSLHAIHEELGAKMVDFGGWSMPLQYGPILDEGRTVRTQCGLFDLGHMGRFQVQGPAAVELTDRVCTNHVAKVPAGGIRYSLLCNEDGFPLDDLLFYREENGVYLVVNASNTERDLDPTQQVDLVVAVRTEAHVSHDAEVFRILRVQVQRTPEDLERWAVHVRQRV